jgi:hypothetical protein
MIQSILDENIEYIVNKEIEENDLGREVSVFELQIFDINVCLSVGEINDLYKDNNVLFAPVYLIVKNEKCEKIGYFEFYSSEIATVIDKDGDLDISILEGPLIFDYVDSDYLVDLLKKSRFLQEFTIEDKEFTQELEEVKEQKEKERKKAISVENVDDIDRIELILNNYEGKFNEKIDKQTEKIYNKEVKQSIETNNWLQKHFKNNKFDELDNEGGGDCFFATIRDSLQDINIDISVQSLRNILSNSMKQENFETYKENFDLLNLNIQKLIEEIKNLKLERKRLTEEYENIKEKAKVFKNNNERDEFKKAALKMKEIKKENVEITNQAKKSIKQYKLALQDIKDFKFMKDIKDLNKFKMVIRQKNYWADSNAISFLEEILNVKFIILLKENYDIGDYDNMLSCGDMVRENFIKKGYFKPKYYIIAIHKILENGVSHFVLLTYKKKKIFTFYEIPYAIKNMIKEKCPKNTLFNLIPMFKSFIGEQIFDSNEVKSIVNTNEDTTREDTTREDTTREDTTRQDTTEIVDVADITVGNVV